MSNTEKMKPIATDYPVEKALCVFYTKEGNFFLGYYDGKLSIKVYAKDILLPISAIWQYQYVLNGVGGFFNIEGKNAPESDISWEEELKALKQSLGL